MTRSMSLLFLRIFYFIHEFDLDRITLKGYVFNLLYYSKFCCLKNSLVNLSFCFHIKKYKGTHCLLHSIPISWMSEYKKLLQQRFSNSPTEAVHSVFLCYIFSNRPTLLVPRHSETVANCCCEGIMSTATENLVATAS